MLWKLYQLAVFFGVLALLIENGHARDTGFAPLIIAGLAAFLATAIPFALSDLLRRGKALLLSRHQRVDHSRLTRR